MNNEILNKIVLEKQELGFNEIKNRFKNKIDFADTSDLISFFEELEIYNKKNEFLNIQSKIDADEDLENDLEFKKELVIFLKNEIDNTPFTKNNDKWLFDFYLITVLYNKNYKNNLSKYNLTCAEFLLLEESYSIDNLNGYNPDSHFLLVGYDLECFNFHRKTEWALKPITEAEVKSGVADVEINKWGVITYCL